MPGNSLLSFLIMGAVLGLSSGISPGPLLALVVSETLRYGKKNGIRIALTPLISDFPIILTSLIILNLFAQSLTAVGVISICGGCFLIFLGIDSLKAKDIVPSGENPGIKSIGKGTIVNILNPHPYLFWITVGSPLVLKAMKSGIIPVVCFFTGFYLFLVGSKILIAVLVDKSRDYLNRRYYKWIMKILGLILLFFAILFFIDGINKIWSMQ